MQQAVYWWQRAAAKGYEPAKFCLGPFAKTSKLRTSSVGSPTSKRSGSFGESDRLSDEELENLEDRKRREQEMEKEEEEIKEAHKRLKARFKRKGIKFHSDHLFDIL
jgi:hypothetical protein